MLKIVCLALFIAAVSAGIPYKDCGHAEVSNVAITGCTTSPCTLHKGKQVTIDIDFTANQDTDKAEFSLHAIVGGLDLDLSTLIPDFDKVKDGCKDTSCPIKKGETKKFSATITIPGATPTIEADVKARLIGSTGDLFCGSVHGDIKD
ncbi:unnamed protein product [Oppiella nova]|uniref:MD-2-related lipid-recognition domain-containing protein n=1 Tax=Oppiella nova TaxID=334625 RepID=A0A7R9QES3_9ACAR|nr:unnamed protein product [Oppiella nova]CAG2164347.1 unnamed protein product [Oppiella nova]